MKRIGNLFDKMVSFMNLLAAYRRAAEGCRHSTELLEFSFRAEYEIIKLREELINRTYKPGPYRCFNIHDPKDRIISVAPFRDRVVHHAIVSIIEPVFEASFIYDSYATRKGKGSHAAILKAQRFTRTGSWYLKMDISKYFDSVDHQILKQLIRKKIKDTKVLHFLDLIIDNGSNCGVGLPIGNLTSQFLANVYLNPLDHFVKQDLQHSAYLRYMDDFVVFSNDRNDLITVRERIRVFLQDYLNLAIKDRVTSINQTCKGLLFLGSQIFPNLIRIQRLSLKRILSRLSLRQSQYRHSLITEKQYLDSLNSINAHISFFNTYQLRHIIFRKDRTDERLQPGESRRQLEQQCQELPGFQS